MAELPIEVPMSAVQAFCESIFEATDETLQLAPATAKKALDAALPYIIQADTEAAHADVREARERLARGIVVASYWRDAMMEGGDTEMPQRLGAHPLACVLAALEPEADPSQLGIELDEFHKRYSEAQKKLNG